MTPEILSTHSLSRHYRRGPQTIRAVDEVDLSIASGEFVAVVGSSGSGKSTLLNLLAGLDTPTSGHIEFQSVKLNSFSRQELARYRARSVGMVFQSFNLLAHRTAAENVELALYFNGVTPGNRRKLAIAMLERLGLADRVTHHPSDLSGGEQQRVAVARALVKSPAILFADEPTGNLDQDNARQLAELLAQLNREGLTIVMVTHNMEAAHAYAHRVVRMNYGRIISDVTDGRGSGL